ncbi:Hypothetical predicted protein [Scomber scombrus]|uniref:Uncharacterized protein n=1 Tax=Scomber scombrus TaxID=13677 RepID=A0AAV1Q027_SCOSC
MSDIMKKFEMKFEASRLKSLVGYDIIESLKRIVIFEVSIVNSPVETNKHVAPARSPNTFFQPLEHR